jgi:hypothetical protein
VFAVWRLVNPIVLNRLVKFEYEEQVIHERCPGVEYDRRVTDVLQPESSTEPEPEDQAAPAPRLDFWFDRWPFGLLLLAILISVSAPAVTAIFYGGASTWTGLATNFAATSVAFLIALAWDRRQRAYAEIQEEEAERRREIAARAREQERRETEAQRRFSAIALELERIQSSLQRTAGEQQGYKYFFPDLPSGSWQAGSGPLGVIIANYSLMADLSTFYGHVGELQWRLRFKAQPGVDDGAVSPIIGALATQMLNDVAVLLSHVRRQIAHPDVQPVGDDAGGVVVARRQMTGAIRAIDFGSTGAEEPV